MNGTENGQKRSGRPRIYEHGSGEYIQEMELRRRKQAQERSAGQRQGAEQPPTRRYKNNGLTRRKEQENAWKMQMLFWVLGALIVLLVAVIIYEIILGHGLKQTGKERMAAKSVRVERMVNENPEVLNQDIFRY